VRLLARDSRSGLDACTGARCGGMNGNGSPGRTSEAAHGDLRARSRARRGGDAPALRARRRRVRRTGRRRCRPGVALETAEAVRYAQRQLRLAGTGDMSAGREDTVAPPGGA
jgi:hypothetical protein